MSLTFKVADSLLYFAKARSECWKLTMVRINCYYKNNDEDQHETGKRGGKGTDRDRDRDKYRVQIQKTNTNIEDKQTNTVIQ